MGYISVDVGGYNYYYYYITLVSHRIFLKVYRGPCQTTSAQYSHRFLELWKIYNTYKKYLGMKIQTNAISTYD